MLLSHHTIPRSAALRRALLSSAVVPLLALPLAIGHIASAHASMNIPQAAGGWGGASGDERDGGASSAYDGQDGDGSDSQNQGSGGGGGSGAIGGNGGDGYSGASYSGGAGGDSDGAYGEDGDGGSQAGGGGGGAHGYTDTSGVLPTADATGGAGGDGGGSDGSGAGGDGGGSDGSGGGGGGGGFGAVVTGLGATGTVSNVLTGGAGGNGGAADDDYGGNAGAGGGGMYVMTDYSASGDITFNVAGTLTGGNGGVGGYGAQGSGYGGNGGSGLYYVNASVGLASSVLVRGTVTGGDGGVGDVLGAGGVGIHMAIIAGSGTSTLGLGSDAIVSGGWNGDHSVQANAVELDGGPDHRDIQLGLEGDGAKYAEINGNVVADPDADDALALAGTGAAFDLSKLGGNAQFQKFKAFFVTGNSDWTLTGTQAGAIGMAAVASGTMQLGDAVNGAALNVTNGLSVYSGATLAVAAGVPVSLTSGSVQFQSGATYLVNVTPTSHSLLTVAGSAALDGAVAVHATDGDYSQVTQPQAILTANGGVAGTFSGVTTDYAFLTPTLSYDLNNVYLTLVYDNGGGGNFADYAHTYNQRNTANAAEALGEGNGVFDAILVQTQDSAANAFDQLSGDAYPTASTMLTSHAFYLRDAVGDRLDAVIGPLVKQKDGTESPSSATRIDAHSAHVPAALAPQTADPFAPAVWAQGYGSGLDLDGDGNAASLSATAGGLYVGLDASLTDQVRAGIVGGISRTSFDVDGRGSSGSADTYELGAYAGGRLGLFGFKAGASHAWNDVSMDRAIAFPGFSGSTSADYDQSTTQIFGEVNAAFAAGRFDVEPFAALAYVHLSDADFTETGATPAALSGHLDALDTVYSTLGVRAATSFQLGGRTFRPSATLGWQHASGDLTPEAAMRFAGASMPFSVEGVPVAKDTALIGAGIAWDLSDRASVKADYLGQLASGVSDNSFTARFSLQF